MSITYRLKSIAKSISYLDLTPSFAIDLAKIFFLKKMNFSRTIKHPLHINIDLTYSCNARCDFCYNQTIDRQFVMFPVEAIKKILAELPRKDCHLFLSGGEPFLHPDIFEIIYLIKKAGHSCGLVTNTTLLNEEKIKKLIDLKLDYIFISLHGNKEKHENITKIKNSFDKVIETLKTFKKLDSDNHCKLHINSVITKNNLNLYLKLINDIAIYSPNTFRLAHPTFNFKEEIESFQILNNQFFDGKIKPNTYLIEELALNNGEINVFVNQVKKIRTNKMDIFFKPELSKSEINQWYSKQNKIKRECFFIYSSLSIDPKGDVYPCPFLKYKLGNVNEDSLANIWNNLKYKRLRKVINKYFPEICRRCCKI